MRDPTSNGNTLSYQGVYPCPVCRLGEIQTLPLMEAMACGFCNHIFTANVERQRLKMADREPPLTWRWNGKSWVGAHLEGVDLGWGYQLAALAFVIFPTILMGLAAYIFPPVPGTRLSWLPLAWTGLVFLSHLMIIGWLVVGFYQFPVRPYLRAMQQNLLRR